MDQIIISDLLKFIKEATSPYQAVEEGIKKLKAAGFQELLMKDKWNLYKGGAYYVMPYPTCLFAFTIGSEWMEGQSIRIAAAHTDHPGFRIKPNAEMLSGAYLKLDTEVYGGPILNTWLDRPLSLAGRVALRSEDPFHPSMKIVDFKRPILTIPNLAIHVNREVNKGVELNKQTDTLPLFGMKDSIHNSDTQIDKEMGSDDKQFFINCLARELNVNAKDILDYDMYIYNSEDGCNIGFNQEFLSCPRLDNLTSVYALLDGIMKSRRASGINLIALYDNEEIGSMSKQGADSAVLTILLKKLYAGLGSEHMEVLYQALAGSMLLSVDVAHAVHPNRPEKYDPNNQTVLNGGVVLKIDSNQKYTFDTEAIAIVQQICEKAGVKYQKFVNRSDMPGGGTLGPIISSWLPIKTVDLGVPLLAMHSAREMMGVEDQEHLENLIKEFFCLE